MINSIKITIAALILATLPGEALGVQVQLENESQDKYSSCPSGWKDYCNRTGTTGKSYDDCMDDVVGWNYCWSDLEDDKVLQAGGYWLLQWLLDEPIVNLKRVSKSVLIYLGAG